MATIAIFIRSLIQPNWLEYLTFILNFIRMIADSSRAHGARKSSKLTGLILVWCNAMFRSIIGRTHEGHALPDEPHAEAKLVRCTKGAIYDVALDLRPMSPTYKEWVASVLSAKNRQMLYIPEGCAHGLLTFEDETEVFYQMSEFYSAESAGGVRWNDPAFGIAWPEAVQVISQRDATYPAFG